MCAFAMMFFVSFRGQIGLVMSFVVISLLLAYPGLIDFTANIIQFGMDQLHDSPGKTGPSSYTGTPGSTTYWSAGLELWT